MKKSMPNIGYNKYFGKILFLVLLMTAIHVKYAFSQLVDKSLKAEVKEFFFFDPLVFYSSEQKKARLDAYFQIPLENLQFKKNYNTKMYDASVNYAIKIINSAAETVVNESFTDYVTTSKNEQKKLEESAKFIVKEFFLNPGKYSIEITLSDLNTKREKTLKEKINIADFTTEDFSFSDIMIVSNLKKEAGKKIITPLVNKNIDNLKDFYLFFEIYNSMDSSAEKNYAYKITNSKDKIIEKGVFRYTLIPGVNKFFEKISTQNLVLGDYKLEISDSSGAKILAEKLFANKMNGLTFNNKDLDFFVDQLIYIANSDELNKIRNAPTSELKEKYFIEFWRSKDPSPNTSRNELMQEYYKRIKIANDRYSHYVDGWKTDMGMVFIIYGEPGNIERYPFSENTKPYEIWDYYNVNKQFIFVDDTGFGDYKLTTPIWDNDGTRLKN